MKLTTENTEQDTPETDDQPCIMALNDNGYQVPCVDIKFARKLERERDEARAWAEKLQRNACQHSIRAENAERERDEAREALADWENAADHVEANHPDEVHCGCVPVLRKLLADARKERDESLLDGKIYYNRMRQLERERDEALKALREIAEASGFDNIGDWARNKARKALEGAK